MITSFLLIPAMLLDAIWGEPKALWSRLPHPAVLMGRLVGQLDQQLNKGEYRKAKGVFAVVILILVGWGIGGLLAAPEGVLGGLISIVAAAILIAQRSLVDHVNDVARGLDTELTEGRRAVSMIVSRDTGQMTGPQVARSAIESGAENFSDGVIAPIFWFLVAGLPGLLIYKLINTADSMIGYRNETYKDFGWAAARLDDLLNLIPARLSAVLIALVSGQLGRKQGFETGAAIAADAQKHRSPNAGWPEAAMARAIGVALAGPRSYDGQMRRFHWVNGQGAKSASAHSIRRATSVLWQAWGLTLILLIAVALLV